MKLSNTEKIRRTVCVLVACISLVGARGQYVTYIPFYSNSSFNSKTININLAVGATEGGGGVQNGGALYSIPISSAPRPKGMNHFKPAISLNYNSMGTDGIVGRGWSISAGVSVISRKQKTIGQNGITEAMCTFVDEFMIDGNRLIHDATYSAAGSATEKWYTEQENFSEIYSYRNSAGQIDKWIVNTKDGLSYAYGYYNNKRTFTSNSSGQNTACNSAAGGYINFYLHSITNLHSLATSYAIGYDYDNSNDRPITLTSVFDALSGASSEVNFSYKLRKDPNTQYVDGKKVKNDQLLDKITVKDFNGNVIRIYNLKYSFDGINSFLSEIQEEVANGEKLNPTIFRYGDRNYGTIDIEHDALNISAYDVSNSNSNVNELEYAYGSGDFNGDGYTDMIAYHKCDGSSCPTGLVDNVVIKFNNKNNGYNGQQFFTLNYSGDPGIHNSNRQRLMLQASDYDGNGVDDLLISNFDNSGLTFNSIDLSFFNIAGTSTSINKSYPQLTDPYNSGNILHFNNFDKPSNVVQIGDFNGDGNTDYVLFVFETRYLIVNGVATYVDCYEAFISYPAKNIYNKQIYKYQIVDCNENASFIGKADKVYVLDMDGDGKMEIMASNEEGSKIFTFNFAVGFAGNYIRLYL